MNALVIDTSSWISFLAGGGPELVQQALDERRVYLPPVVAAELLSGRLSASGRLGVWAESGRFARGRLEF